MLIFKEDMFILLENLTHNYVRLAFFFYLSFYFFKIINFFVYSVCIQSATSSDQGIIKNQFKN